MFTNMKKALAGIAALGALALGGSAIAGAATSGSSNSSTTPPGNTAPPQGQRPNFPAHGSAAHEDAEKPVTGDAATKAGAAAVKSLGGGTAGEVTTDFTGDGYEVTITKADGSKTEVHLDKSFSVMQGRPGPH
jgi:hypothetical protein